jgi:hypothetical protein
MDGTRSRCVQRAGRGPVLGHEEAAEIVTAPMVGCTIHFSNRPTDDASEVVDLEIDGVLWRDSDGRCRVHTGRLAHAAIWNRRCCALSFTVPFQRRSSAVPALDANLGVGDHPTTTDPYEPSGWSPSECGPHMALELVVQCKGDTAMELRQWQPGTSSDALIEAFYSEHGEALLAYATRLARDQLIAENLLQETLLRASRPGGPPSQGLSGGHQVVAFYRRGRLWRVELGNHAALVQHSLGMTYLATLLANPGYEIACIELAAGSGVSNALLAGGIAGSGQAVLDDQAKRAYQEQLSALEAEVDEYESNQDLERAERARSERDWLIDQLTVATGLAGRVRSFTGNEERARVSVGKAIRRAMSRISGVDPVIGEALEVGIHTGIRCSYRSC